MSPAEARRIEAAVLWAIARTSIPEHQHRKALALRDLASMGYAVSATLPGPHDPMPPRRLRVIPGGRQ